MFTKFCIRALLIVSCVFGISNLVAGVSDDTIVQTQDGPKPMRVLKIDDKIFGFNMQNLSIEEEVISAIEEVEAPRVVEITTSDNVTFYVAADQKLFVTHKWVEAQQLTLEDVLLTKDRDFVKVVGLRHLEKPMTLRFITVDEHSNFFAAENGVLIHNGLLASHQAYWTTKISLYAALGLALGGVVVAGGTVAYAGIQAVGSATTALAAAKGATDAVVGTYVVSAVGTAVGVGTAAEVGGVIVTTGLVATGTAIETAVIAGTVTTVTTSTISTALAADAAILAGEAVATTGVAASTLAAIEAAALAAAAAAMVCPWTPW